MLTEDFFNEYPLYRKYRFEIPSSAEQIVFPSLHAHCPTCQRVTTFTTVKNLYADTARSKLRNQTTAGYESAGRVAQVVYTCASCADYKRFFLIYIAEDLTFIEKVGQVPSWSIDIGSKLRTLLGEHESDYKKGLVCESQGYGIASFAYYRRIVENVINDLLDKIASVVEGDNHQEYLEAVKAAKSSRIAKEKIQLVKDKLPSLLRPNNINPLQILYERLSIGIHKSSDEECLEYSADIRNVLLFLVEQLDLVKQLQESQSRFNESAFRLLESKANVQENPE